MSRSRSRSYGRIQEEPRNSIRIYERHCSNTASQQSRMRRPGGAFRPGRFKFSYTKNIITNAPEKIVPTCHMLISELLELRAEKAAEHNLVHSPKIVVKHIFKAEQP